MWMLSRRFRQVYESCELLYISVIAALLKTKFKVSDNDCYMLPIAFQLNAEG